MFDDESFDTGSFSTESWLFPDEPTPAPTFVLGVRKPRKAGRPHEEDEALLMMFGML